MAPTRLHESDLRINESTHGPAKKVGRRYEIGVEDRDEGRRRGLQAMREGPGLEPGAAASAHMGDRNAPPRPAGSAAGDYRDSVIVRVVEYLHLEAIARPLEAAYRVDDTARHVALVVDGYLHADQRLVPMARRWLPRALQAGGVPGQVKKVGAEAEEQDAGRSEQGDDPGGELH